MGKYTYTPNGVCSRQILIEVDGDIVKNVTYIGGCNGNTQGIGAGGRKGISITKSTHSHM